MVKNIHRTSDETSVQFFVENGRDWWKCWTNCVVDSTCDVDVQRSWILTRWN